MESAGLPGMVCKGKTHLLSPSEDLGFVGTSCTFWLNFLQVNQRKIVPQADPAPPVSQAGIAQAVYPGLECRHLCPGQAFLPLVSVQSSVLDFCMLLLYWKIDEKYWPACAWNFSFLSFCAFLSTKHAP
mmetsp:Transcript_36114/g.62576  ORF Transcript_36114/g.62576 Transcript_36114/m.62576 type:complete len:129 (-) Transcript_36114:417-803(-)